MFASDLFKEFKDWLLETILIVLAVIVLIVLARGVQASDTPVAQFYLSGAIAFGILAGRWIERWSRSRK